MSAGAAALLSTLAGPAVAWEVQCSDGLYCIASVRASSADGLSALFKLERGAEPDGPVFVTTGPDVPLAVGMTVEIDILGLDEPFGVYGEVDKVWAANEMTFGGPARRPLVENLLRGETAIVTVHFGGDAGTIAYEARLAGLAVALVEFDRRQGRMNREDAIVAWGGDPADDGAAASEPSAPPSDDGGDDDQPASAQALDPIYDVADLPGPVTALGERLGCSLEEAVGAFGANAYALDDGGFLWVVSCHNADVNVEGYVVAANDTDGAGAELVRFDAPPGEAPEPRRTIVNPVFDAGRAVLEATLYHSPNWDCGFFEVHAFLPQTRGFELVETRLKEDCDGVQIPPSEFPLEWTAEQLGR